MVPPCCMPGHLMLTCSGQPAAGHSCVGMCQLLLWTAITSACCSKPHLPAHALHHGCMLLAGIPNTKDAVQLALVAALSAQVSCGLRLRLGMHDGRGTPPCTPCLYHRSLPEALRHFLQKTLSTNSIQVDLKWELCSHPMSSSVPVMMERDLNVTLHVSVS